MGVLTPKSSDLPLSPWLTRKDLGPPPPSLLSAALSTLPPAVDTHDPVTLPSSGVFSQGIAAATVLETTLAMPGQPAPSPGLFERPFGYSTFNSAPAAPPPAGPPPPRPEDELVTLMNDKGEVIGKMVPDDFIPAGVYAPVVARGSKEEAQTKQRRSSPGKKAARGQEVTFVNDKGEPVIWTTDSAPKRQRASARIVIERKLLERPDDIREAARNLSQAFEAQANELRKSKPNELGRLAQYENLTSFFEQMAAGLADLADALDRAFASPGPEPLFIGKAADIARALQLRVQQWIEKTGTDVVDVPIRIGLLFGGISFLHGIGADSLPAIGALSWLIRPRRENATAKKPVGEPESDQAASRPTPSKKTRQRRS
jgi:hypothetical protein